MDEELRIEAIQSIVATWSQRNRPGKDSRKKFHEYLKKALEETGQTYGVDEEELEITTSAIVVGPSGTLLHAQDLMPMWSAPKGSVKADESPWDAALREASDKTGVDAHHPDEGPRVVHAEVQEDANGRPRLDLSFLLFADREPRAADGEVPEAKWFKDEDAKAMASENLKSAFELAHSLRDEATR